MASAVDSRLAYARLSAVATASRLPTANRGSNNSYTTSWDTTGKDFRDGLSLVQIAAMFPDDATAKAWFVQTRWPDGPHCPYCGSTNVQSGAKHKTMPYRCREKECAKRFSVRTNTPLDSSNLGFQVRAIAIYLLTTSLKGVSSMKLHRDLGIAQSSAWHLGHRLREGWEDFNVPFAGPVEIDETYIGGKEMNKHARKKLRAGRGAVGKAIVVGAPRTAIRTA